MGGFVKTPVRIVGYRVFNEPHRVLMVKLDDAEYRVEQAIRQIRSSGVLQGRRLPPPGGSSYWYMEVPRQATMPKHMIIIPITNED